MFIPETTANDSPTLVNALDYPPSRDSQLWLFKRLRLNYGSIAGSSYGPGANNGVPLIAIIMQGIVFNGGGANMYPTRNYPGNRRFCYHHLAEIM